MPAKKWTPARIRGLRDSLGLGRERFGRLILASAKSVERWEKGETEPAPVFQDALDRLNSHYRRADSDPLVFSAPQNRG